MAWFAWFETLADASLHHDAVESAAKYLVMVRSGPSGPRLEPRKDPPTAIFQTVAKCKQSRKNFLISLLPLREYPEYEYAE